MSIVLIDAGNSRVKVSVFDPSGTDTGSESTRTQPVRTPPIRTFTPDALNTLADLVANLTQSPQRAIGVSVTTDAIRRELDAILAPCPIEWLTPGTQLLRLKNRYHNPAELGPDRWLGLLGILMSRPVDGPMMLVSFGTATTIDTIDGHETFLGGLILPGVSMMQSSLGSGTARLPIAPMPGQRWPAFPQNTQAAIATGIVAAQTGAVLRQWQQVAEQLGQAPRVFVTGGARAAILPELQARLDSCSVDMGFGTIPLIECESPVLDGLRAVAQDSRDA